MTTENNQEADGTGTFQTSIPEEELSQLMALAHAAIQPLLDTQEEYAAEHGTAADNQSETGTATTPEEQALQQVQEENELRASLGLSPLPEQT